MINWISVTEVDKLPPDKELVLTISLRQNAAKTTKTLATDWLESGFGGDTGREFANNHGRVTHWAPLSELGTDKLT